MSHAWLDADASLALVGCDRQTLEQACRDSDVAWRARNDSGTLLEPPYQELWTGAVDWSARPPRFAIAEPVMIWFLDGPNPPPRPPRWCLVEIERESLLTHFGQPEPLAVRIVGPISVVFAKIKAALGSAPHQAAITIDEAETLAWLKTLAATNGGALPDQKIVEARAREHFKNRFPGRDTLRRLGDEVSRRHGRGRPRNSQQ